MRWPFLASLTLASLAACGGGGGSNLPAANCNPLGDNHCMTPWPSSAFEVADSSSATGRRLAIPAGTLPTNQSQVAIDPAGWNRADGFSPAAPIVVSFDGGIAGDKLVGPSHLADSIGDSSPTVIVDMNTGEKVVHFAELDVPAAATPDRQALYLRPAQRLIGGHRYAVALRTTLTHPDGTAIARPPGFQDLLDGTATDHPLLEQMRPRFGAVLDALAAAGVAKDDLLLAWDFTVASDDFITADLRSARDQAVAAMAATPPDFTVTDDVPIDDGSVWPHEISGTFTAPLFLTSDGQYTTGTVLARNGDGTPELSGTYQVPFTAIIPACAYTASAPVGIMIYGHGLLGDSSQVGNGAVRDAAAANCVVGLATDLRGMSTKDIGSVVSTLANLNLAPAVFDVLVQGIVNHVALETVGRGAMAQRLFVDGQGRSIVDPSKVYYYGLSQGGIFGTTIVAYDPVITRGVTGVGAANYSLLLERSTDWPMYKQIITGAYPDPLDGTLLLNLMQMRWDTTEPAGIAHIATAGTPLGVSPKQILLQMAMGDDEVANIASEWEARTMGLTVLDPSPLEPYGLDHQAGPLTGSAMVIMDGGAPAPPEDNEPAPATGMHELTRTQPASWRQIGEFWVNGDVLDECNGACVCPAQCQ